MVLRLQSWAEIMNYLMLTYSVYSDLQDKNTVKVNVDVVGMDGPLLPTVKETSMWVTGNMATGYI